MILRNEVLESLRWRYATKVFDATKKISDLDWKALEEVLILTPSSYGLQPWKFLVITDHAVRQKLLPFSWNQNQIVDCSHLVVFLGNKDVTRSDVEMWVKRIAQVRNTREESLKAYEDQMVSDLVKGPRHAWIAEWAARQAYIALGNLMTSAALLRIDTCPIEGLDPAKYDEILALKETPFRTLAACAVGYRSALDRYAALPKVRYSESVVLNRI